MSETTRTILIALFLAWMIGFCVSAGQWAAAKVLPHIAAPIVETSVVIHQSYSDLQKDEP